MSVECGPVAQYLDGCSPAQSDGSHACAPQHNRGGVVCPRATASCMLLTDDDTLVDIPDPSPLHAALVTTALERHKNRLRDTTGTIVQQMLDLRRKSVAHTPPTGKPRSRLLLGLHNANGVVTMYKRLQALYKCDAPPPIWDGLDLVVIPECKSTAKTDTSVRSTLERMISTDPITLVIGKHPHDMARHGNAIAYLHSFVADCRAYRVRDNLSVVSSRTRRMQDLCQPCKYDALSLDRVGAIDSTFTGEGDSEWYSDCTSSDGRWVEVVGWLHGERYPTRRVVGHYGMYGGTSAENDTTHSPSTDSVHHDEHLLTYIESVPRDNLFVLMGDFNRIADLQTGVWTSHKPPLGSSPEAMAAWRKQVYDQRIPGATLRDEHMFQRFVKAGLVDASTALHKPLVNLSSGGWYGALRAVLLSRIDFIFLNQAAVEEALQAENSVDLSVVARSSPHMVHQLVNARSGGTDHCIRTIYMLYPTQSRDVTGTLQNMLYATTMSPRYERTGRGFRGFQKTCWYYNMGPIQHGSEWIHAYMQPTQGERRGQMRQQCISLLYMWEVHQGLAALALDSIEPSVCASATHHLAVSSMSIYSRIVGYGAFPAVRLRRFNGVCNIINVNTSLQKWVPFIKSIACDLHTYLQSLLLLDTVTLGWANIASSSPGCPGESASMIQYDAIHQSTVPGDMYSTHGESTVIATRSPYRSAMIKDQDFGKLPSVTTNKSSYWYASGANVFVDTQWLGGSRSFSASELKGLRYRLTMNSVKANTEMAHYAAYGMSRHLHERDYPVLSDGHRARYVGIVLNRYISGLDADWSRNPLLCNHCLTSCRRIVLYVSRRDRLLRAVVRRQMYHSHSTKFLGLNDTCLSLMAKQLDKVCVHMHDALSIASCECTCSTNSTSSECAIWRRLYMRMRCPFRSVWKVVGPPKALGCEPWSTFLQLSKDHNHVCNARVGGTTLKHDNDIAYSTCVEIASRAWFRAMATLDRPCPPCDHKDQDPDTSSLCGRGPVKQQWLREHAGTLDDWASNYHSEDVFATVQAQCLEELETIKKTYGQTYLTSGNVIRPWRTGCGPASMVLGPRAPFCEEAFLTACKAPVQWCSCSSTWSSSYGKHHPLTIYCKPIMHIDAPTTPQDDQFGPSIYSTAETCAGAFVIPTLENTPEHIDELRWNDTRWTYSSPRQSVDVVDELTCESETPFVVNTSTSDMPRTSELESPSCSEVSLRDGNLTIMDTPPPPVGDGTIDVSNHPYLTGIDSLRYQWKAIIAAIMFNGYVPATTHKGSWVLTYAALKHSVWQWYWNTQSERRATWWECPHGAVQLHGPCSDQLEDLLQHPRCTNPECVQRKHTFWLRYLRDDRGRPSPMLFAHQIEGCTRHDAQVHVVPCIGHVKQHIALYSGDPSSEGGVHITHLSSNDPKISQPIAEATLIAQCPDTHSVTIQNTHTSCTSTTCTSTQGELRVQTSTHSTHTSSVTVQVDKGARLSWDNPAVRGYMRERRPESRTLTWRGIVLCALPLDIPWAEDATVSDVLSKSITQRLSIPRTHQDEASDDTLPSFEQQPVSVRLDSKPVQLPTGQHALHFTAMMDAAPSNLWDRGDVLRGNLTQPRLAKTQHDPMMSLSDTLFGPDDERVVQMQETLSKGLSGHAAPLPFQVFALGAGESDDITLTAAYERMRDVMPCAWKMAQDQPIQQSAATTEALKNMLAAAWNNKDEDTVPLEVTLAQYLPGVVDLDAEHTCCLMDKAFDSAWVDGYQQHVRDNNDGLSFGEYKQLRSQAYRDRQLGSVTSPLKVKLSIGPPPGVRGTRTTVSAILDTGASLTLMSLSCAKQLRDIFGAYYISLPPDEAPTCGGAYGGRNTAKGFARFTVAMHDQRDKNVAAMIDTSAPSALGRDEGYSSAHGATSRSVSAFVFDGLSSPVILGMDWIRQNRCRICAHSGMVYLDDPSFFPAHEDPLVNCTQVPTYSTHTELNPTLSGHDYILVCATDTTTILPHAEAQLSACVQWGPVKPDREVLIHVGDTSYADKFKAATSPTDDGSQDRGSERPFSLWRAFRAWMSTRHDDRRWRQCSLPELQDRHSEGYIVKAPTGGGVRSGTSSCSVITQLVLGEHMNSNAIPLRVYNDSSEPVTIQAMHCIGHVVSHANDLVGKHGTKNDVSGGWEHRSLPQAVCDLSYASDDRSMQAATLMGLLAQADSSSGSAMTDVELVKISPCCHKADHQVYGIDPLGPHNMCRRGTESGHCPICERMDLAKASHIARSRARLSDTLTRLIQTCDDNRDVAIRILATCVHGLRSKRYLWYPVLCWLRSDIQRLVALVEPNEREVYRWAPPVVEAPPLRDSTHGIAALLHKEVSYTHAAYQKQRSKYLKDRHQVDSTSGFCPVPLLDVAPSDMDINVVTAEYEDSTHDLQHEDRLPWSIILSDSVNETFDGISRCLRGEEHFEANVNFIARCMPSRRYLVQRGYERQRFLHTHQDLRDVRNYVQSAIDEGMLRARQDPTVLDNSIASVISQAHSLAHGTCVDPSESSVNASSHDECCPDIPRASPFNMASVLYQTPDTSQHPSADVTCAAVEGLDMDRVAASAIRNVRSIATYEVHNAQSDLWRAKQLGQSEFQLADKYDTLVAAAAQAYVFHTDLCCDRAHGTVYNIDTGNTDTSDIPESMRSYFQRDSTTGQLRHTSDLADAVMKAFEAEKAQRTHEHEFSSLNTPAPDTPCESAEQDNGTQPEEITELAEEDDEEDDDESSPPPWWWDMVSTTADEVICRSFDRHRSHHPDVQVDPSTNKVDLKCITKQLQKVTFPQPSDVSTPADTAALQDLAKLVLKHSPVLYQGEGMGLVKGWTLPSSFMQLVGDRIYAEKARTIPMQAQEGIVEEINRLVKEGILEPSSSPWSHAMMAVRKKDGKWRLTLDCRALNSMCVLIRWPLRSIQEMLAQCAGKDWITVSDLTSGYWQIGLQPELRPLTAFSVWNVGKYQWTRMPQGFSNSAQGLSFVVQAILGDLCDRCCKNREPEPYPEGVTKEDYDRHSCVCTMYADDLTIASTSSLAWHVRDVDAILTRLSSFAVGLSAKKTVFASKRVTILGYDVSSDGVHMSPDKVATLLECDEPTTRSRLHAFNGLCSFYRRFCPGLADHARYFTPFLKKGAPERIDPDEWRSSGAKGAFDAVRLIMAKFTCLAAPDLGPKAMPGGIIPDASQWAIGACCFQEQLIDTVVDGATQERRNIVREVPLGYYSRVLTDAETRWSATERELKALVDGHAHFKWVSLMSYMKIITDHSALVYLFRPNTFSRDASSTRLYSLALAVQHIQAIVEHRRGSLIDMSLADWPSRSIENPLPTRPRTDVFSTSEDDAREERLLREHKGDAIPRVLLLRESPYYQGDALPAWGDDPHSPDADLAKRAAQYAEQYMAHPTLRAVTDDLKSSCRDLADNNAGGCAIVRHGFIRQPKDDTSFGPIAVYADQTAGIPVEDRKISTIYKSGQYHLPSHNNDDILCLHVQHDDPCYSYAPHHPHATSDPCRQVLGPPAGPETQRWVRTSSADDDRIVASVDPTAPVDPLEDYIEQWHNLQRAERVPLPTMDTSHTRDGIIDTATIDAMQQHADRLIQALESKAAPTKVLQRYHELSNLVIRSFCIEHKDVVEAVLLKIEGRTPCVFAPCSLTPPSATADQFWQASKRVEKRVSECGRVGDVIQQYKDDASAAHAFKKHYKRRIAHHCPRITRTVDSCISGTCKEIDELCEQIHKNIAARPCVWDELGDVWYGVQAYVQAIQWEQQAIGIPPLSLEEPMAPSIDMAITSFIRPTGMTLVSVAYLTVDVGLQAAQRLPWTTNGPKLPHIKESDLFRLVRPEADSWRVTDPDTFTNTPSFTTHLSRHVANRTHTSVKLGVIVTLRGDDPELQTTRVLLTCPARHHGVRPFGTTELQRMLYSMVGKDSQHVPFHFSLSPPLSIPWLRSKSHELQTSFPGICGNVRAQSTLNNDDVQAWSTLNIEDNGYVHQAALILPHVHAHNSDNKLEQQIHALTEQDVLTSPLSCMGDHDCRRAYETAFMVPPTIYSSAAGMGGMTEGFIMAGYKSIGGDEASSVARSVFALKYESYLTMNSYDTEIQALYGAWIMEAGSSCKAMAPCGHQKGTRDVRSKLYVTAPDKALAAKVPLVVLEQVPTTTGWLGDPADFGAKYETCGTLEGIVRSKFKAAGYAVGSYILNSADYGSSVVRERVFTIAVRGDIMCTMGEVVDGVDWQDPDYIRNVDHPNKAAYQQVQSSTADYPLMIEGDGGSSNTLGPDIRDVWRDADTGIILPRKQPRDDSYRSVQATLERDGLLEDAPPTYHMKVDDIAMYDVKVFHRKDGVIQLMRRKGDTTIGDKLLPSHIYCGTGLMRSPTAAGNTGYYVLRIQGRYVITRLTARQVACLMGLDWLSLPSDLSDEYIYSLVGNAVVPCIAHAIANALKMFWHPTVWHAVHERSVSRQRWMADIGLADTTTANIDTDTPARIPLVAAILDQPQPKLSYSTTIVPGWRGTRMHRWSGGDWYHAFGPLHRQCITRATITQNTLVRDFIKHYCRRMWVPPKRHVGETMEQWQARRWQSRTLALQQKAPGYEKALTPNNKMYEEVEKISNPVIMLRVPGTPSYVEVHVHIRSTSVGDPRVCCDFEVCACDTPPSVPQLLGDGGEDTHHFCASSGSDEGDNGDVLGCWGLGWGFNRALHDASKVRLCLPACAILDGLHHHRCPNRWSVEKERREKYHSSFCPINWLKGHPREHPELWLHEVECATWLHQPLVLWHQASQRHLRWRWLRVCWLCCMVPQQREFVLKKKREEEEKQKIDRTVVTQGDHTTNGEAARKGPSRNPSMTVQHAPILVLLKQLGLQGRLSTKLRDASPILFDECTAAVQRSVKQWLGPSRIAHAFWGLPCSPVDTAVPLMEDCRIRHVTNKCMAIMSSESTSIRRWHYLNMQPPARDIWQLSEEDGVAAKRILFNTFRHRLTYSTWIKARPGIDMLRPYSQQDASTYGRFAALVRKELSQPYHKHATYSPAATIVRAFDEASQLLPQTTGDPHHHPTPSCAVSDVVRRTIDTPTSPSDNDDDDELPSSRVLYTRDVSTWTVASSEADPQDDIDPTTTPHDQLTSWIRDVDALLTVRDLTMGSSVHSTGERPRTDMEMWRRTKADVLRDIKNETDVSSSASHVAYLSKVVDTIHKAAAAETDRCNREYTRYSLLLIDGYYGDRNVRDEIPSCEMVNTIQHYFTGPSVVDSAASTETPDSVCAEASEVVAADIHLQHEHPMATVDASLKLQHMVPHCRKYLTAIVKGACKLNPDSWQLVSEDKYMSTPVPLDTHPPGTVVQLGTLTSYHNKDTYQYIFSFSSGWEPKGSPHTMRWLGIRAVEQMKHLGIHTTSGPSAELAFANKNRYRAFFKTMDDDTRKMLNVVDGAVPVQHGSIPYTHINFWGKHKYQPTAYAQSLTCSVVPPPPSVEVPSRVRALWDSLLTVDASEPDDIVEVPASPDIVTPAPLSAEAERFAKIWANLLRKQTSVKHGRAAAQFTPPPRLVKSHDAVLDHFYKACPRAADHIVAEQAKCLELRMLYNSLLNSDEGAHPVNPLVCHTIRKVYGDIHQYFLSEKKILYRLDDDGKPKLVVPQSMRYAILAQAHESHDSGHVSANSMVARLRESFWWPHMRQAAIWFYDSCIVCARTKRAHQRATPKRHHVEVPAPGTSIQVDLMGAIGPPPIKGSKTTGTLMRYCVVIVEEFSHHVYMAAIEDNRAATVADVLLTYFFTWGFPTSITTGRDVQLISKSMDYLNASLGIHHKVATSYSPEVIGANERSHDTIIARLTAMCADNPNKWPDYLPAAAYAINNTPNRMTKRTPMALRVGTPTRGPLEIALTPPPMGHTDCIKAMHQLLRITRDMQYEARQWMTTYKRNQLLETEQDKHKLVFAAGDECVVHLPSCQPLLSKKLAYRYHGPYKVLKADVGNDRYQVDIDGRYVWVKTDRLKKFHSRHVQDRMSKAYKTMPETGAIADSLVSSILLSIDIDDDNMMAQQAANIVYYQDDHSDESPMVEHALLRDIIRAWRHRHDHDDLDPAVATPPTWACWRQTILDLRHSIAEESPSMANDTHGDWQFVWLDGEKPTYSCDDRGSWKVVLPPHCDEPEDPLSSSDPSGAVNTTSVWIYETAIGDTLRLIRGWFGGLAVKDVCVEYDDTSHKVKQPSQTQILEPKTKVHILNNDCLFLRLSRKPLRAEGTLYCQQKDQVLHPARDLADDDMAVKAIRMQHGTCQKRWVVDAILAQRDMPPTAKQRGEFGVCGQITYYFIRWAPVNDVVEWSWEPEGHIRMETLRTMFGTSNTIMAGDMLCGIRILHPDQWTDDDREAVLIDNPTWRPEWTQPLGVVATLTDEREYDTWRDYCASEGLCEYIDEEPAPTAIELLLSPSVKWRWSIDRHIVQVDSVTGSSNHTARRLRWHNRPSKYERWSSLLSMLMTIHHRTQVFYRLHLFRLLNKSDSPRRSFDAEIYARVSLKRYFTQDCYTIPQDLCTLHGRYATRIPNIRGDVARGLMVEFFNNHMSPMSDIGTSDISNEITGQCSAISSTLEERSERAVKDGAYRRQQRAQFIDCKRRLCATGDDHVKEPGPDHNEYCHFLTQWGYMEQRAARHERKDKGVQNVLVEWQPSDQAWLASDATDSWMVDIYLHATPRTLHKRGIDAHKGAALQIHPSTEDGYAFRGVVRSILPGTNHIAIAVNTNDIQHESFERATITAVDPIDPIQRSISVIPHVLEELRDHVVVKTVTNQHGITATDCSVPEGCSIDEKTKAALKHTLEPFNEEQQAAQQAATHAGITLILGPPGTGKSSCAIAIILACIMRGERVIVAAASNDAADSLHLRLIDLQRKCRAMADGTPDWEVYRANAKSRQWSKSCPSQVKSTSLFERARRHLTEHTEGTRGDKCSKLWAEYDERGSFASVKDQTYFESCVAREEKNILLWSATRVIVATCSSLAGNLTSVFNPHTVLLDEAATITELELTASLKPCKADTLRRVVLIGDPAQLPPCVISKEAKRTKVTSWMERLWQTYYTGEASGAYHLHAVQLVVQYRCHPGLIRFSNQWVYRDGGLIKGLRPLETTDAIVSQRIHEGRRFRWRMNADTSTIDEDPWPIAWFNVAHGSEDSQGRGYDNFHEVEVVLNLIFRLIEVGYKDTEIAVISPYLRQVNMITTKLSQTAAKRVTVREGSLDVRVGSVDATQGLEFPCVIMSTVRTVQQALPFVKDLRRSNVSLTRAKVAFFFVGHFDAICSRIHPSKDWETRQASEAWHWLGNCLKAKQQIFDSTPQVIRSLVTNLDGEDITVKVMTVPRDDTEEPPRAISPPPPSLTNHAMYNMDQVRGYRGPPCDCRGCSILRRDKQCLKTDMFNTDIAEQPVEELGQYGMLALLSYRLHFLCNSKPTPLDLWYIWQRSGQHRLLDKMLSSWGFDLSYVVPILLCPMWRCMHTRGLALCPTSLGTHGRGDSRHLYDVYHNQGSWCSQCMGYMPPVHDGAISGTFELPDDCHIHTPYHVCSTQCESALKRQHDKMTKWLCSTSDARDGFYSFIRDVSNSLSINLKSSTASVNAAHVGETTAPIRTLGRDWAGKPMNSCMIGHQKTLHTVIPHIWMRSRSPGELYQDSGIVHRRCNNTPFKALLDSDYKPLHPVQLTTHAKTLTWRPIRDRLPLYLGYGIPTVCVYSPNLDAVLYNTYPDVRHGMDQGQIAGAEGRDNTQLTGLKPKCVPMLLHNLHDGTTLTISSVNIPDRFVQQMDDATTEIRLKDAWEQYAALHSRLSTSCNGRPEDDPRRNLIASIRSMCLAAVSCNLAYFVSAYASVDAPIAIHIPNRSYVQHPNRHLRAGPGATGDPTTRPDLPIGKHPMERGYIVGIGQSTDSLEWAVCERVGFGEQPIRVRMLHDPTQTRLVAMADIKYVKRDLPSDYAQSYVVSTEAGASCQLESDDPDVIASMIRRANTA